LIPFSDLKDGVKHCLNNGKRLLDDAKFLHDRKRYASAIPLYIIAYEELNKGFFLEDFLFFFFSKLLLIANEKSVPAGIAIIVPILT